MKTRCLMLACWVLMWLVCSTWGAEIKNVTAVQRWPWNGKVDIQFEVEGELPANAVISVMAENQTAGTNYTASAMALSGDTGKEEGTHHVVWDLDAQGVSFQSSNVVFTVAYGPALYCVIDLSGGASAMSYPVSYLDAPPSGGFNSDAYKTTKLVLRRIEAGDFLMGSTSESDNPPHKVTLTKSYYIGVFEVTQKQYLLVMGSNPSKHTGDKRPVEQVSWNAIRGDINWPSSSAVSDSSFMGRLRARTGLVFDLPTEAQWEIACRGGTTSYYNNGGNALSDLDQLGRYAGDANDGKGGYSGCHTTVGSYLPNAWGLYDMHGNVWEWCLDWYGDLAGDVMNPVGATSGTYRVNRGGCWGRRSGHCDSSDRRYDQATLSDDYGGFRLVRALSDNER